MTVSNETGEVLDDRSEPSPFAEEGHGQGLQVARWLMGMEVDVVVTRADLKGRGPYYALHDARVRILQPETDSVEAALSNEGVRL